MHGAYLTTIMIGLMLVSSAGNGTEATVSCDHAIAALDKLICEHPDLRDSDRKIAGQDETLRHQYGGEDRRVFEIEYARWRNDLQICALPGFSAPDGYRCIRERFDQRQKFQAELASRHNTIQEAATEIRGVDPWYVDALPKQYEGRAVNVQAEIHITDCDKPGMPRSALLRTPRSLTKRMLPYAPSAAKQNAIEIRFERMQDVVKARLCEKRPYTYWTGTVKLDHGRPYLYVPELYW